MVKKADPLLPQRKVKTCGLSGSAGSSVTMLDMTLSKEEHSNDVKKHD
jgi:hypothetical protein